MPSSPFDSRGQAEPGPQFYPDAVGLAKGSFHLPLRSPHVRIAVVHGIATQRHQTPPERRQRGIMGLEQVEKILQVMRLWYDGAAFLQQGLEILLPRLLAMEAHLIP